MVRFVISCLISKNILKKKRPMNEYYYYYLLSSLGGIFWLWDGSKCLNGVGLQTRVRSHLHVWGLRDLCGERNMERRKTAHGTHQKLFSS